MPPRSPRTLATDPATYPREVLPLAVLVVVSTVAATLGALGGLGGATDPRAGAGAGRRRPDRGGAAGPADRRRRLVVGRRHPTGRGGGPPPPRGHARDGGQCRGHPGRDLVRVPVGLDPQSGAGGQRHRRRGGRRAAQGHAQPAPGGVRGRTGRRVARHAGRCLRLAPGAGPLPGPPAAARARRHGRRRADLGPGRGRWWLHQDTDHERDHARAGQGGGRHHHLHPRDHGISRADRLRRAGADRSGAVGRGHRRWPRRGPDGRPRPAGDGPAAGTHVS